MNKIILDNILDKHNAQPVGHGYIDIIIPRDNYREFVTELVINGFKIRSVSWWGLCEDKAESEYGLGGPKSFFSQGWFSEIPINIDDFNFSSDTTLEDVIKEIIIKIETKTISFSDEIVQFNNSNWLTPAIWLDVPKDWRNKYNN